ncbi:MAG: hypothetical protein QOH95_1373, partial [Gaiellaceae bacterium]|nr:hypothetical protein [Gaiellaceae bacterium]
MKAEPHKPQDERLLAAAISLKMIAATQLPDIEPLIAAMAHRFGVGEIELCAALDSPATQRAYDRIHSNTRPMSSSDSQYIHGRLDAAERQELEDRSFSVEVREAEE